MSTTPTPSGPRDSTRPRSTSRTRIPSRPTTPLRPSSRNSLRTSQQGAAAALNNPLDELEGQFAELSDGMADLEANFMHLQLMHESLARFSESFAAFLYGLNMNAFCVDFGEAPVPESFRRAMQVQVLREMGMRERERDVEATFLTNDTSFVEHPPTSSKASSKYGTPRPEARVSRVARGSGAARGRGQGIPRASGIARGRGRGTARGTAR
ncbi:hypothetical protein EJ06DRAFT_530823 [Trichodelitschia bisporula]|uniref:DASH complex subunit DAM1 n=1 Tax=Trichodelitschia bisporula TaxID=703511 RepID=A0A6G1HW48_9PEZI|nr:hypothetical protein EJ06DRAFT_530823 [Trichodelitschia bisporula]